METVTCNICSQEFDKKDCIKIQSANDEVQIVCKNCKPEYEQEIETLWHSPKIKLANMPIKKVV